ncbi:hydantoinase/oxoprolinase N-terminal domain-containing protein [Kordiimonas gwangyangensis]|uniref:hydantoinase/oxoprolinase N-terminal domain-containing protein n=1 Tax=Kordiimonas gwangyangensis TaxID=288022 RepID=UPI0003690FDB|nr:hydantoinase/oxoprolinase family protein [Kordiimonas gwangyangensis]
MRIGVDVGGTNTDAVLLDGEKVLSWCKKSTTPDVESGIVAALTHVLDEAAIAPGKIQCVMIGTTHFTNAFVERRHLLPVGVIRIALPAARALPPLMDWPADIAEAVGEHVHLVRGGYQYDGRINAELDEEGVRTAARALSARGLRTVAITGLFSSVNSDMENRAAEIVREEMGEVSISLSHTIGRIGILERENATIMNASLADLAVSVVRSFGKALKQLDISAPFYISQNDGTLMSAEFVERYPVLTFASGPTNSMRGAAYLSGVKDALVADIGGTTTDIGMLVNGYPRESSVTVDIGGVRTNFRMPDVLAVGLGGGSLVLETDGGVSVGPKSVGYRLLQDGRVFGGGTLTTTDVAVAAGYADIGDKAKVASLGTDLVSAAVAKIHAIVAEGVDRMKTSGKPVPLILVGGGAVLIRDEIAGTSQTIVPDHAGVANAIGAAIAQIGAETDKVVSYEEIGRDAALKLAKEEAMAKAVEAGAVAGSVEIIDIEEVPLAYVPGGAVRVRVKAAGRLDFTNGAA